MKKVMHLMSTQAFSGAENVACQIMNAFKKDMNYEMFYVSKINENKKELDDRKINYYKMKKFNYSCIKKAVRNIKPDIIHAHDIKASIMASLFYKDAIIISHVHSNHENMRKKNIKTILYNFLSKKMYKIIWVSKSALDNYKFSKQVKDKSEVLYNVINPKEIYENIDNDNKEYINYDLIFLGRMNYAKNPARLIKIISLLKEKKKDVKVALVGSGELDSFVKNLIKEYKLENNIHFYGFVSNPYKILNSSKIMIMTSLYEGTPMCALEAISCGLPIISTKTDGLNEIVKNEITGFLVDDDELFVEKIKYLLDNPNKLLEMRKNVLDYNTEVNNMNKYYESLKNIYEQVVK